jgi:hypothetical protein
MKMFIDNINDEFLKSGLQLLFDGRSSEEMVSIMIPRKERLIREYEATLDFILKGLRGYSEIKSTRENTLSGFECCSIEIIEVR